VQAHRPEIAVAAPETGLHHEVEADLIERLPTDAIVESAQSDGRFILLAAERCVEQTFMDCGRKAAAFCPRGHGACLLVLDHGRVGKDRRAFGRGCDDVDILQNKMELFGLPERQQAKGPEVSLAEMAKTDQPQTRG